MTEAFLMEDTLMRVLVVGLARELPLSPGDALDIADKLVARAANAQTEGTSGKSCCVCMNWYFHYNISLYRPTKVAKH